MRRPLLLAALVAALLVPLAAAPALAQQAPDVDFGKLRDFRQSHGFKLLDDP
jgi:hypothetical protein